MEFRTQLSIANKYEEWIGNMFNDKNIKYGSDNKYDILLSNGKTIEVKHDYQSATGNIAIEFYCRGKPSGISVSKADYYFLIYPLLDEIWKIKTKDLKNMILDFQNALYKDEENWTSNLYYRDNVAGGDDDGTGEGRSRLHLFRRDDVRHKFKIIKIKIPRYNV